MGGWEKLQFRSNFKIWILTAIVSVGMLLLSLGREFQKVGVVMAVLEVLLPSQVQYLVFWGKVKKAGRGVVLKEVSGEG